MIFSCLFLVSLHQKQNKLHFYLFLNNRTTLVVEIESININLITLLKKS